MKITRQNNKIFFGRSITPRFIFIIFVIMLLMITFSISSCSPNSEVLRVYEVKKDDLNIVVDADCRVQSSKVANLGFELGGKIKKLAEEDEEVKEGDMVAELYSEDIDYEIKLVQKQIEVQEKEVELAKVELGDALDRNHVITQLMDIYNQIAEEEKRGAYLSWEDANRYLQEVRNSSLYDKATEALALSSSHQAEMYFNIADLKTGKTYWEILNEKIIAENAISLVNKKLELIEKNITLLEEQKRKLKLNLDKYKIYSPISGKIVEVFLNVGEVISAGQPIINIINMDEIEVVADVDEDDIGRVKKEQEVEINLDAYPSEILKGKVKRVSNQNKDIMGVIYYKVYIDLIGDNLDLLVGLSGDVNIIIERIEDAVLIPNDAIKERGRKEYVYLNGERGNIIEKEIKIGSNNDNFSEVLEGLRVGDNIFFPEDLE